MMVPDPLLRHRSEFPILEHSTYLFSNSLGATRDVVVDYRPGVGIRMAPHLYTDDAELDRAFESIDEIRATGAWRRWLDRPVAVR